MIGAGVEVHEVVLPKMLEALAECNRTIKICHYKNHVCGLAGLPSLLSACS
jgi:hypothetical protein